MKRKNEFNPDWCMVPGNYLKEVIQVRKISKKDARTIFWGNAGKRTLRLDNLLSGKDPIEDYLAANWKY